MGLKRLLGDVQELRAGIGELFARTPEEEAACTRLVTSTRRFARNTKEAVDDKLSFSATLMRAGEVGAAQRLIEELEVDVRNEEAALIEEVNEVRVAQSLDRDRVTRVRLARMMALAMAGSLLLTLSAVGVSLAGAFGKAERETSIAGLREARIAQDLVLAERISRQPTLRKVRHLRIGNVRLLLTAAEFNKIRDLTNDSDLDSDALEDLIAFLPEPLAAKVQQAMTIAAGTVSDTQETAATALESVKTPKQQDADRTAAKTGKTADQPDKGGASKTNDEPTDDAQPDGDQGDGHEPKPSPTPSEDPDDQQVPSPLGAGKLGS